MVERKFNGFQHIHEAFDQAVNERNTFVKTSCKSDEIFSFCSNPTEYEWSCLGKQEMLVPFNCDPDPAHASMHPAASTPKAVRWEKHRVWVVEGKLRRGESNTLARRCFYLDENSWLILLGEGYDFSGMLVRHYVHHNQASSPSSGAGRWYLIT